METSHIVGVAVAIAVLFYFVMSFMGINDAPYTPPTATRQSTETSRRLERSYAVIKHLIVNGKYSCDCPRGPGRHATTCSQAMLANIDCYDCVIKQIEEDKSDSY